MKLPKKIKLFVILGFLALITHAFIRIIIPPMSVPLTNEQRVFPTNSALRDYRLVLESAGRRHNKEPFCDKESEEQFKFKDQWENPIRCRVEGKTLILSSDGEDKIEGTDDDVITTKANK